MRRPRTILVAAAAVVALALPAIVGAQLAPTPNPLPGSSFQGGDGDQAASNGLTDWDSLRAQDRVVHNSDPNDQDTAFAGGTKEEDPAHWVFSKEAGGVTPGKANILDAWSAVDQPAGRTFLYLAFSRNAPTGTTFLSFELNRVGGTWKNDKGEEVPCRREGDILVSYEINGTRPVISLRKWHTGTTDPKAGCDRTGTIEPFTTVGAGKAQGALNNVPIANGLPGISGNPIPAFQFGEAALDLEALLGSAFKGGCFAFGSIWMHSRSSDSYESQMQDRVAPRPISVRTCAAEGTKFFDLDADGVRDPSEPGIPGFQIYADYDDNGKLDPGEPSTVTDENGRYVLDDIRGGTYRLRERLLPTRRRALNRWLCSFPHDGIDGGFGKLGLGFPCGWGPIDPDVEPNAEDRDFGNWYPAELTLVKDLVPADDPGRFDLLVNGKPELLNAPENGSSSVTLEVAPGTYTVTERAVFPTELSQYTSTPSCKLTSRRGRASADSDSVTLAAGGHATCRILNVRVGHPAITIAKSRSKPAFPQAGDTLHYELLVKNADSVPFPADQVHVTDSKCMPPPVRTATTDGSGPDDSLETLDPGDEWTYECSHETDAPGEPCRVQFVHNVATVTGTADGETVKYSDALDTTLTCKSPPDPPDPVDPPVPPDPPDPPVPVQPDEPIPPAPVVPGLPLEPGAVFPSGSLPPRAGAAGVAGIASSRLARCVTRLPRMALRARHISRVAVSVDGRRVGVLRGRVLQRRLTIARRTLTRAGRLAPGLHRVAVRVRFRLGSGTRPLRLVRRVRICRALLPRFTG